MRAIIAISFINTIEGFTKFPLPDVVCKPVQKRFGTATTALQDGKLELGNEQ